MDVPHRADQHGGNNAEHQLSPYVAAYFAVEKIAQMQEKLSAIWAIDLHWLEIRAQQLLQTDTTIASADDPQNRRDWMNTFLKQNGLAVIANVDPRLSNERMASQQGIFLCKLFHEASFSQTLMSMMIHP